MPATLKDIAQACSVDVSTASRALRGDPRVAPDTVERLRAAADRLGYRPNLAARALRAGATKTVWFLTGSFNQLPLVPMDKDTNELDLGDTAPTAEVKPAPAKGSVVRRSGRMSAAQSRTPVPSNAEPTLEPARAVQPEPDLDPPAARPAPAAPAPPARAAAPAARAATQVEQPAAHTAASHGGPPAWIIPVLGVVAAIGVVSSIVLVLMTMSTAQRAQTVEGKLEAVNKEAAAAAAENDALKAKLADSETARTATEAKRADLATQLETLRGELAQDKAEIERLKAEAAKPAPLPAAGQPGAK